MDKNLPYQKYLKAAFIINIIGIVLTFAFKGNIGVLGTFFIMLAVVLAVIGVLKKRKYEN